MITLARQNGQRADVPFSKLRISKTCEAISKEYGLRVAPTPDSTAGRWPTRAEVEKCRRQHEKRLRAAGARSGIEPARIDADVADQVTALASPTHPSHPRNELKELVQRTAARSSSTEAFIANLQEHARRTAGQKGELVVRTYRGGPDHQLRGYAVGFKNWTAVAGGGLVAPVMYGGSKLDAWLLLPRLQSERGWLQDLPARSPATAAGPAEGAPSSRLPTTNLKLNLRHLGVDPAAEAGDVDQYFAALRERGVVVQPRYSVTNPEEVTGYKVGLRAHRNREGDDLEWIAGRRLRRTGRTPWASSSSAGGWPAARPKAVTQRLSRPPLRSRPQRRRRRLPRPGRRSRWSGWRPP
ncbi:MAG TPA: hypothetical protein VHL54_02750 [Actinomycetota bacterium]|nr:hypothetical protein [Actinomycetota bacterium]